MEVFFNGSLRQGKIELAAWLGQRREMAAKRRQEGGVKNAGLTSRENDWLESSAGLLKLFSNNFITGDI